MTYPSSSPDSSHVDLDPHFLGASTKITSSQQPVLRKPYMRNSSVDSFTYQDTTSFPASPLASEFTYDNRATESAVEHNDFWPQDHDPDPKACLGASVGRAESWCIAEILCLLLAVGCLVCIAVVVRIHDGQPLSSWDFYLSLNTLVSTLGAVARTSVLFATSVASGQGKWTWFQKRASSFATFDLLDNASRGPHGIFKLLLHLRSWKDYSASPSNEYLEEADQHRI